MSDEGRTGLSQAQLPAQPLGQRRGLRADTEIAAAHDPLLQQLHRDPLGGIDPLLEPLGLSGLPRTSILTVAGPTRSAT
jgi:hypothetical protein